MKKFLFSTIATVLFSTFLYCQNVVKLVSIPIPTELQSDQKMTSENQNDFTVIQENKNLKMIFDNEKKIVSAQVTQEGYETYKNLGFEPFTESVSGSRAPSCARKCEDKPTDFGVVLCLYNCLYDLLFPS